VIQNGVPGTPHNAAQPRNFVRPVKIHIEFNAKVAKALRWGASSDGVATTHRSQNGSRVVNTEIFRFNGVDLDGMEAKEGASPLMHASGCPTGTGKGNKIVCKATACYAQFVFTLEGEPRIFHLREAPMQGVKEKYIDQRRERVTLTHRGTHFKRVREAKCSDHRASGPL
jgi:hypothetical protein